MTPNHAVDRLASLAQETRLRIFRLLVQAGPAGMNAGAWRMPASIRSSMASSAPSASLSGMPSIASSVAFTAVIVPSGASE